MECSSQIHADAEANLNSIKPPFSDPNLFTFMQPFSSHEHGRLYVSVEPWSVDDASIEVMKAEECIIKERKKRLSAKQLESLERSFKEEPKLAPTTTKSLAKELNLNPRQVAVWFQNRRARQKTRQLKLLYDELKLQFNTILIQKQILQEKVLKLQAMLSIQESWNQQVSTFDNYCDISIQPPFPQAADLHLIDDAWLQPYLHTTW